METEIKKDVVVKLTKAEIWAKAEVLVKDYRQALVAKPPAAEIAKKEETLWEWHQEREKALVLSHREEVRILAQRIDALRGEIALLGRNRTERINNTRTELERFLIPHKYDAIEKLGRFYTDLERLKTLKSQGEPRFDALQQAIWKSQSPILAVLEAQKDLAITKQNITDALCSISELEQMVVAAEKKIPKSFKQTDFKLSDAETLMLREFLPSRADLDKADWIAEIQAEAVINRSIGYITLFTKPRVQIAA